MKIRPLALVFLITGIDLTASTGLGVSSFTAWAPGQITKADSPHMRTVPFVRRWYELEPQQDVYKFEEEFGPLFAAADADDLFVSILIYVGPDSPEWIYSQAPEVLTDHPINRYPYYFDSFYDAQFKEMIAEFGAYIQGLPANLQDRIVFVFCAEGATADGAPYKGDLLSGYGQYDITKAEWNAYRIEAWQAYKDALPAGMPVVVNSDANTAPEDQWLIDNVEVVSLKYGMFSHGYHISDGIQRLADFRDLESRVYAAGKPIFTHGEQDAEIFRHAWGTNNLPQAIYWGGIYATHNPIDVWNVPRELLRDSNTWETYIFFNRFAGVHDPATSPRAFIALRDGLNSADTVRFPAAVYGSVQKSNQNRYVNIANAFSAYGARMEDPEAATGGGIVNRQREGYNDAGWNILPGNYSRFIEQINPGSGDVGWWHVDVVKKGSTYGDASPYSRFARGFENASGKNAMYFDLDDALFGGDDLSLGVRLKVIYFDEVAGSQWELRYDNGSSMATALQVTNQGDGTWKTLTTVVYDAVFANGGPSGADLSLVNTDGLDDIFHMIDVELEKPPQFASSPITISGATIGLPYSDSLEEEAEDPNGDSLDFQILSGPPWLSISTLGVLSGTPGAGDAGLNEWVIEVVDPGGHSATSELLMVVNPVAGNQSPTFFADLFQLPSANLRMGYTDSLSGHATDPQGDPLTYTLVAGPSWLAIEPDGKVIGLPGITDEGLNLICVQVEDPSGNAGYALVTVVASADPVVLPPTDPLHFDADFTGSTANPNPFSNSSPIPFGGLENMNNGTTAGLWQANNLEASSVYTNNDGNKVLFAGTGAFDLEAVFQNDARIEDQLEITLDFGICRTGTTPARRTFVTGLTPNGLTVFRILMSGNGGDDGGRTLYFQDGSGSLTLLASNLARAADNTFSDGALDVLVLGLDQNGLTIELNGSVLASQIALYTPGVTQLSSLRFEGDSTFFDNIRVISQQLPVSEDPYLVWEELYELVLGPDGDDDLDGVSNLLEFALGGIPSDPSDRGIPPSLKAVGGNMQLSHAFRENVYYDLETSQTLQPEDWNTTSFNVEQVQSLSGAYNEVTFQVEMPVSGPLFLRVRVSR